MGFIGRILDGAKKFCSEIQVNVKRILDGAKKFVGKVQENFKRILDGAKEFFGKIQENVKRILNGAKFFGKVQENIKRCLSHAGRAHVKKGVRGCVERAKKLFRKFIETNNEWVIFAILEMVLTMIIVVIVPKVGWEIFSDILVTVFPQLVETLRQAVA